MAPLRLFVCRKTSALNLKNYLRVLRGYSRGGMSVGVSLHPIISAAKALLG